MKIVKTPSRLAVLACCALAGASCGIEKQSAPDLAGPSEFALSIGMTATPDSIVQDGVSQSVIHIVTRGPDGRPMPGVTLNLSGSSTDTRIREIVFTASTVVTDANGQATLGLVAPPPPATVPSTPPVIVVSATPVGSNALNAVPRQVEVRLLAPPGTPLENLLPNAVILADPPLANFGERIRFDASLTTDEGVACGSRCQYIWEFGDNTAVQRGMVVDHTYALPGNYTVTLSVTDDRGGSDTATTTIRVIGPSAPVANFTVTPASPAVNTSATFNASSSTVGAGASITEYAWDFGDGSATVVTTSPTTSKSYTTTGAKTVTLTVTDSLGRTASRTSTVTVVP